MGDFAQPPENIAGLAPEVFPDRTSRRDEAAKGEGVWDKAVAGSEVEVAPGPR